MLKKLKKILMVLIIGLILFNPRPAKPAIITTTVVASIAAIATYFAGDAVIDEALDDTPDDDCEGHNCSCMGDEVDDVRSLFSSNVLKYIMKTRIRNYRNAGTSEGGDIGYFCMFCPLLGKLFDAINTFTTDMFNTLGKSFLTLLGLGLLFIILFKVGKMVMQFKAVDPMQFLGDLFKPLGRGIIATALLLGVTTQSDHVFNMITGPIFETSLNLGIGIMDKAISDSVMQTGVDERLQVVFRNKRCSEIDTMTSDGKAFTPGQKNLFFCWLETMSANFLVGVAMGSSLIDAGIAADGILTTLALLLTGIIFWLSFWLIFIMIPFKLLDPFFRIAFVLALMPLWIVLWVFPITASYTKRAFEMFLNGCFYFVVLTIMVTLGIILISEAIPENTLKEVIQCLRARKYTSAGSWLYFGSGAITNLIAFSALAWTLLKSLDPLVNHFLGGGGSLGIGDGIVGGAAKTAGVAISAGKAAGSLALAGAGALGSAAMAAGRNSGGGSGGGSGSASSRGAALGRYGEGTSGSSESSGASGDTSSGRSNDESNSTQNDAADTTARNDNPSTSSTAQPTQNDAGNTTAQQTNNGSSSPEARAQENINTRNAETTNGQAGQDNKREQQDRAKDEINRSSTADQTRQNKERSESQEAKVANIESQQRGESQTKDRKQLQQEEAIHKLQQNNEGVRATQDLAANMAFIQEQVQSSATVDELRDKLKDHDWQYSGNSKAEYGHYMNRTADAMFNAQRSGDTEKMRKEISSVMYSSLKHGRISYLDDVVNNVVQKSGNISQIIDNLNNLTKKE